MTTEKAEPFALIGIACLSIYLILFVIFIPSNVTIAAKDSEPYRHKTKKINFFVIAHNRKVGKPIKTPG